jgi:hypothetical protein
LSAEGGDTASGGLDSGSMNESPLRPDENEYRTEVDTESYPPEPGNPVPAAEPRPWIVIALALLVVFVGILIYAVVLPLL